jgi:DNA-binding NtrC family response regulator
MAGSIDCFEIRVLEGPSAGLTWRPGAERCAIGTHESNDLVLADRSVSRFHCELVCEIGDFRLRDLGSRNGTVLDGVAIIEARMRSGSLIRIGQTTLSFQLKEGKHRVEASAHTRFGGLHGDSIAMRRVFAVLGHAAQVDSTVLVEGETGTGKEGVASALHSQSVRREQPFVIVDCGSIPPELLESELFGHEKGAFTGAAKRRVGAFEEASRGTLFLDEIGELPIDLQAKLLRALESRHIKRVGSNTHFPIDVRIVAATNRDLRSEVNAGRFRSDLYYRLAVVKVRLPPLRERPEDIPGLTRVILAGLHADAETTQALCDPDSMSQLQAGAWPGNVRELRNHLERCLAFRAPMPVGEDNEAAPASHAASGSASDEVDVRVPYYEARRRINDPWERRYIEELLRLHDGHVGRAAKAAGISRGYLYERISRLGIANK